MGTLTKHISMFTRHNYCKAPCGRGNNNPQKYITQYKYSFPMCQDFKYNNVRVNKSINGI